MRTGDKMLSEWGGGGDGGARIPSRGGVVILSVASRYGNRVKLRQMSHLACDDFTFTLRQGFYDSNQTLNNAKEKKERESRGKGKKIGNTHLADLRKKKKTKHGAPCQSHQQSRVVFFCIYFRIYIFY